MDDDSDSRPSFSASGNSQQLSNHGLEGDEYFEDPQNMYGEDIINEDHIIYGYVDNDDDYPEYAHLIDEDNLRLVDDMAYVEDLEMPDLASFPSEQDEEVKKDLFAIVAGVMMANGSKLDSGLTAAEFDLQLQEVTGGQINMLSMAAFMKISNEEVDAINKQKGNLLLHDVFKGHLYYSAADGTFKLNPPSQLKELRETIKHGSACREKRKEKANIVKNARMRDPEFRKKLMVSNNFLVELIVACCNSLFTTKVTWVQVQAEYKKMMTEETFLYSKYKQPLRLDMIRENIGPMLNANACRELFGRGTVSKALSSEIFGKIKWTNNENQLILHLGGDFKNSLKDFTYNAADFKDVQERIDREKARSDVGTTRRPDRPRQPTRLEREQQELEERKKTFEPIMPPDTFIPNFNEMAHRFHPGNKIRHAGATTTTRAVVTNVFDETVNDHFLTNTVQDIPNHREAQRPDDSPNIFGGGRTARSVSDEALSSVGSARANEVNFTDDEAEEKSPKREAIANKAEEQEKNTTPKSKVILEMFGDTKLVKKNGTVAHPEKLLRDKVIGFFFSALGNPCAKSDAAVLKEFHTKMKTSYQPFEVVYVSFDMDEKDFERHFQGDHGDWLAIPFGTKKLAEIKARFPTAGLSQLHVLKPDGTCATEEGMVEIKYSKNYKACFDKWLKFGNPMNMSQPNRPEALPQIVATSASRWKVPVESETAREKYNRVDQFIGDAAQPESSAYGSTVLRQPRIRSSVSAAFQNHCPSEQSKKPHPPRLTARKIVDDYQDDSEDPSLMSHKALFILHIKLHVYLHRNIDGAPIRYWSRMMSYLPPPFNMPQVFLGDDWVATLMDAIPCLQVTATPHDDLLFDWVDKNMTRGENVSIRY